MLYSTVNSTEKLANMQILSWSFTSYVEDSCKNPVNSKQNAYQAGHHQYAAWKCAFRVQPWGSPRWDNILSEQKCVSVKSKLATIPACSTLYFAGKVQYLAISE